MDWSDKNTLWLDLHELGYPVKQNWVIRFEGNKAKIELNFRGVSAGKMELSAHY